MNELDFNRLSGPQQKVLRETLLNQFERPGLDVFLVDNGFDPLDNLVARGPFRRQVFDVIKTLSRAGRLDEFIAAATGTFPGSPYLEGLEDRLREAGRPAPGPGGLWRRILSHRHRRVLYLALGAMALAGGMFLARGWLWPGSPSLLTDFTVEQPANGESIPLGSNRSRVIEGSFPVLGDADTQLPSSIRVEVFKLPDREPVAQTGEAWLSTVRGVWSDQAEFSGNGPHEIVVTASVGNHSDFRKVEVDCTDKSEYFDDSFETVVRRTGDSVPATTRPTEELSIRDAYRYFQVQERNFWQAFNERDYDRAKAVSLATLKRHYQFLPAHPDDVQLQLQAAYMWKNYAMALQRLGDEDGFETALKESDNTLRLLRDQDPGNAGIWNGLGSVHALRGDYELAERYIKRALDINPDYPQAKRDLEQVRERLRALETPTRTRPETDRSRPG